MPTASSPRFSLRTAVRILFLLFLIAATVSIIRRRADYTMQQCSGQIFGTTYTVKYIAAEDYGADILAELQRVDASLSLFNGQSTLSRINSGKQAEADAMLLEVLQLAEKVSQSTNGAFDVTVGPLVNAWGFGFARRDSLSPARVDSLRALVGHDKLRLDGTKVIKADARMVIDCGAIAKGYGVDRVAALLRRKGVADYMVEVGGEVVVRGQKDKNGTPWAIGINKPTAEAVAGGEMQTVLELHDCALATSGNYLNFYEENGRRYAHTIDPATGYPVQHSVLSATVIAPSCAEADAYATSFMVMGLDKARKLLGQHKELKAYIIYSNEQGKTAVWQSPSFPAPIQ